MRGPITQPDAIAERIRAAIADRPFDTVSASFGAARVSAKDTPEQVYQRADDALYRAKNNGRNRVERG